MPIAPELKEMFDQFLGPESQLRTVLAPLQRVDGIRLRTGTSSYRDAQLRSLLTLETSVAKDKLRSVLVYGGFPLSARHVVDGILNSLGTPDTPELSTARASMPTSEMDE